MGEPATLPLWVFDAATWAGVYLFVLGWSTFWAAAGWAHRTRQKQRVSFPFLKCALAGVGPSLPVAIVPPVVGWNGDSRAALFFGLWALSAWASYRLGLWMAPAPSLTVEGDDGDIPLAQGE